MDAEGLRPVVIRSAQIVIYGNPSPLTKARKAAPAAGRSPPEGLGPLCFLVVAAARSAHKEMGTSTSCFKWSDTLPYRIPPAACARGWPKPPDRSSPTVSP